MYRVLIILITIMILSGCSAKKAEQSFDNKFENAEDHIKFIIEEYSFGDNSNYISNFVNNEFATNEFIIDSLAKSYSNVKETESFGNDTYKVVTDKEVLEIYLKLSHGKIEKIKVKAGNAYE